MLPNRLVLDLALLVNLQAEFVNEFLLGFGWLFQGCHGINVRFLCGLDFFFEALVLCLQIGDVVDLCGPNNLVLGVLVFDRNQQGLGQGIVSLVQKLDDVQGFCTAEMDVNHFASPVGMFDIAYKKD